MKEFELKDTDSEDIDDTLRKVESSFDIEFTDDELFHLKTFGELCDHIINKIQLVHSDDCTSQQAFYKLRKTITQSLHISPEVITPETTLASILPSNNRRSRIKDMEMILDFKLHILRPPYWVFITLLILSVVSLAGLFIKSPISLAGLALSISGFWLAFKTANVLSLQTVGELTEKITRENYLKSRRNPKTFNKHEVEKVLIDLFSDDLGINKSKLTREATFK
ncbi:MAG: hypothetical protein J7604_09120 [Sporocytophaga sp.]|uniref:acyl carrier protein n=1 Tax=Sporocytophaga sp. TaxID=2231183 RepID=UPI001B02B882|nr:hypothetical protein [Sporocytophaga sp.]MBO9700355.1 hypothetical protein [Sporocytophaga sp.]